MKRQGYSDGRRLAAGVLCAAVAATLMWTLAGGVGARVDKEEAQMLLRQARRAAATCYASEGRYPQTVEYLEEAYGLHYDTERYIVRYDAFASNIMPDIDVLVREEKGQ